MLAAARATTVATKSSSDHMRLQAARWRIVHASDVVSRASFFWDRGSIFAEASFMHEERLDLAFIHEQMTLDRVVESSRAFTQRQAVYRC